jgi:hypothetical protein
VLGYVIMNTKRTYFRVTTAPQRRLLFEGWAEKGDHAEACRRAPVAQGTLYKWKPRFAAGGCAALEKPYSRAPRARAQTPASAALDYGGGQPEAFVPTC